jgi:hypothetical protein
MHDARIAIKNREDAPSGAVVTIMLKAKTEKG